MSHPGLEPGLAFNFLPDESTDAGEDVSWDAVEWFNPWVAKRLLPEEDHLVLPNA
jgi:hypothetical protein